MNCSVNSSTVSRNRRETTGYEQYFQTEHLKKDLQARSFRGGVVTLGAQGAKFALGLLSTAILARLLRPQDFGLVAMVTSITAFIGLFKDLGLSIRIWHYFRLFGLWLLVPCCRAGRDKCRQLYSFMEYLPLETGPVATSGRRTRNACFWR